MPEQQTAYMGANLTMRIVTVRDPESRDTANCDAIAPIRGSYGKPAAQISLCKTCLEPRCLLNGREQLTLPENVFSPPLDWSIDFADVDGLTHISELSVTTWNTSESEPLTVQGWSVVLELGA